MENNSQNVLTEAKYQYTIQLQEFITPSIYNGFRNMYIEAKQKTLETNENVIKAFQKSLSKIPKWGDEKKSHECTLVLQSCNALGCDYLDDLITAVFVTNATILTSVKGLTPEETIKNRNEINLNVPKSSYLIHKIYVQCARNFWRQPWLLHTEYSSLDLQKNGIKAEKLIQKSIEESIRKLLPVKNILKQYLSGNTKDFEDFEDDITSVVSQRTKSNIRALMQHEFGNTVKLVSEDEKFSNFSISEAVNSTTIFNEVLSHSQDNESCIDNAVNELESFDTNNHVNDKIGTKLDIPTNDNALVAENFDNRTVSEFSVIESDLTDTNKHITGDTTLDTMQSTFSFFEDAADF